MNSPLSSPAPGWSWLRPVLILFITGFLLTIPFMRPAYAATFNPDCTVAQLSADLTTANSNGVADIINLSNACTYGLTSALPQITSQITINGNGATITRNSGNLRILSVSNTGN